MELDDLKRAIGDLDREAVQLRALRAAAHKERTLDRTRASLRPVLWEHVGQVALGVLIAVVVGPFWWSHRAEPNLLAAGLLLHVYAVLMIAMGARVVALVRTLDLDAPVVEIQKTVAGLRRAYVATRFVVGLPWWLLWLPLVMVLFGVDLVDGASRTWLVTNLVFGVAGVLGTLWYYRHLWTEPAGAERRRKAEESAASKSFRSAQRFLDEIARFERE